MGISSAGIGSGLDVNSLVSQLLQVERQPLNSLTTKKQTFNDQLSAFGKVKSDLDAFKTAIGGLKSDTDFSAAKATSSDTSLLTAMATSTASAGSYDIKISQLAQAGVKAMQTGVSDPKAAVTPPVSGTFDFTVGSGASQKTFNITLDGSESLEAIRDKINAATVTTDGKTATQTLASASIVNTGTSAAPSYKLVIASTGKGTDGTGYLELNANYDLGDGWGINGHVGQLNLKNIGNGDYTDWKVGVTKDVNGWVFGLSYVDTNAEGSCSKGQFYCFAKSLQDDGGVLDASSNKDSGRGIAIVSVSRSF